MSLQGPGLGFSFSSESDLGPVHFSFFSFFFFKVGFVNGKEVPFLRKRLTVIYEVSVYTLGL